MWILATVGESLLLPARGSLRSRPLALLIDLAVGVLAALFNNPTTDDARDSAATSSTDADRLPAAVAASSLVATNASDCSSSASSSSSLLDEDEEGGSGSGSVKRSLRFGPRFEGGDEKDFS